MATHIVETTSHLVAWQIDSLDEISDSTLESEEFKIGQRYWSLGCWYGEKIQFTLKAKYRQSFPNPIASIVTHVFCSKGTRVITNGEVYGAFKFPYEISFVASQIDESTLHATTPFTFSVEFLDLQSEDVNDSKTKSIWKDEHSEQYTSDTSDEPISRMLSERIYTDIIINAKDGSIEAHRAVLGAYSPVFRTMFSDNHIEKETSTINIDDMSIGACTAMLNFIYGNIGYIELQTHIMELMVAADKYDIAKFKTVCEAGLCEDVGSKNVFERLLCARRYNLLKLKSVCLFYLVKMGMIFDLREDYNSFILEADTELIIEVSNAFLDGWKAT